jgi:hypothetical protein
MLSRYCSRYLPINSGNTTILTHRLHLLLIIGKPIDPSLHQYAWAKIVQHDKYANIVHDVMNLFPQFASDLAHASDHEGRPCLNIASPKCQAFIKQFLFFLKRYEILTLKNPHHESLTSLVHLAIDHHPALQNDLTESNGHSNQSPPEFADHNETVALKFIKSKEHFNREIITRQQKSFDPKYIMDMRRSYDGDEDAIYNKETMRHKLGDIHTSIL